MTVGMRLVTLRKAFHVTQAQVAEAVNVDLKTIRRYEQDKYSPHLETIAALSNFYGVSSDDIVFGFSLGTWLRLYLASRDRGSMERIDRYDWGYNYRTKTPMILYTYNFDRMLQSALNKD